MVANVTTNEFEEKVIASGGAIAVLFKTKTCVPCRMFLSIYEELANENPHLTFFKLDAEEEHKISSRYDLMSVPTVAVFNNGEYLGKLSGNLSKESILGMMA